MSGWVQSRKIADIIEERWDAVVCYILNRKNLYDLCRELGITRTGFYSALKRSKPEHYKEYKKLIKMHPKHIKFKVKFPNNYRKMSNSKLFLTKCKT